MKINKAGVQAAIERLESQDWVGSGRSCHTNWYLSGTCPDDYVPWQGVPEDLDGDG